MKNAILIIIGILFFIGVIYFLSISNINTSLNAEEFISKYKNSPDAILIDVRTPSEYNFSHIKNSINIDFENSNFVNNIKKIDKNKDYYIYCRSGFRSGKALIEMKQNGIINVHDLAGGIISSPQLLNN